MPRIYENDLATDTQGQSYALDQSSNSKQQYAPVAYHIVDALPISPDPTQLYSLSTVSGNYPKGLYSSDVSGYWSCVVQYDTATTLNWSGAVSASLIAGVSYVAVISGDVTNLNLTIDPSFGSIKIMIANGSGFAVSNPATGYKRGSSGLDYLSSTGYVEVIISKNGADYIWSAIQAESI